MNRERLYSQVGCVIGIKAVNSLPFFWEVSKRVRLLTKLGSVTGKIEGKSRRGWQRMRWLDSIPDSNRHESEQTPGDSAGQGSLHGTVHVGL